jgi:hypothetical protein
MHIFYFLPKDFVFFGGFPFDESNIPKPLTPQPSWPKGHQDALAFQN